MYGKLRATDFLPVGPEQEEEQLYRGIESESVSESDDRPSDEDISEASDQESDDEAVSRENIDSDGNFSEVSDECNRRINNDMDVSE